MFLLQAPLRERVFVANFVFRCISLHEVPAEFWIFVHSSLLHQFVDGAQFVD